MERALFGTDGIRGLANHGDMSPEVAFRIGMAVTYLARGGRPGRTRIVIGKDTRLSGYLFETALASCVCAMGGEVLLSGPLPTPAIAHLTQSMRADAGVVISASHNPYQDNGIKIFGADGFKLADSRELELEALVLGDALDRNRPTGAHIGRAERLDDAPGRYISFVKAAFPDAYTLEGLKVVVDAAHGAAYRTAPLVFEELGAKTYAIGVAPNGRNINHQCGALHPQACARKVVEKHADIGIALDGDADRLIVVDERGRIVDGDTVMAMCASRMLQKRTLKKRTLVATVMSNLGLERALAKHGGKLLRTAVGDRYVVEAMRARGLSLGGEQSGHLIFLDHSTTGDGLVAALRLLSILVEEQRPLSELADEAMTRVPQVLLSEQMPSKLPLPEMARTRRAIKDAKTKLGQNGRVLVRWSGTEPKLRVMLEGPNDDQLKQMANAIMGEARHDTRG